tara:strand:- start:206 stop:580 length:375 start_codon:yes stop_codon:yes gene_type:complete
MIFIITFIISFSVLRSLQDLGAHLSCKEAYKLLPTLVFVDAPFRENEFYIFLPTDSTIHPYMTYIFTDSEMRFRTGEWIMGGFISTSPITLYWRYKFKKWFKDNANNIEEISYKEYFKDKTDLS